VSLRVRIVAVLLVAFAFGVLAAWAKGPNLALGQYVSQLRGAVGNLSTPWLLLPFFAGTQCSRLRQGALVGLAATLCAFVGFYLLSTLVENLGGHGFLGDLRLELTGNRAYFEGGVVTGPIFGALGAWWRRRPSARVALLVGALLIAEPLVMVALGAARPHVLAGGFPLIVRIIPGWGLTASSGGAAWAVYEVELLVGLAMLAVALTRRRRQSSSPASTSSASMMR
jgi:MYXO-CTERM domain-containing protein